VTASVLWIGSARLLRRVHSCKFRGSLAENSPPDCFLFARLLTYWYEWLLRLII